jgi:hypothetical protein
MRLTEAIQFDIGLCLLGLQAERHAVVIDPHRLAELQQPLLALTQHLLN